MDLRRDITFTISYIYEVYRDVKEAILRERQMKSWNRKWKIRVIEEKNPKWEDLYTSIT